MPVCGNYLFFELPKKIVLNPKDGRIFLKTIELCLYKSLGLVYNNGVRNRAISTCAISSIG